MDTDSDDDPVSWKTFHNTTREYVIFLLLFISLYLVSYCFICLFRKRVNSYPDCYEDAFANKISLWLSSFSLSVSIGAALLLPISIISNEVLLLYPNSYYVQWLNSSLIQGLWNLVFLFSNASLFLFLPFSHFIIESEGFSGSSKGIMARVNEALLVLGLVGLVIMGIIYIISAILDNGPYVQSAFNISNYYLPFLYSCVSFLGVLMLLLCTPVGFARLFSVMADLLMKRKVYEQQIHSCIEKANCQLRPMKHSENDGSSTFLNTELYQRRIGKLEKVNDVFAQGNQTIPEQHVHSCREKASCELTSLKRSVDDDPYIELYHRRIGKLESVNDVFAQNDQIDYNSLKYDYEEGGEGRPQFSISSLRRNCLYPFVMLILLLLTILSVLMVSQNTLELCFGIKSLPIYSQNLALGISSLSALGPIGAAVEIIMILYLWCTSIVGLYSLPLFRHLKPKLYTTSLSQVIGNCAVLLVLSSALPVLARSLGITNFDLLGDFGRINWLGNFYIVVFHNIVFAVTVAICLGTKITGSVRNEIYERLCLLPGSPFMWISSLRSYL